MGVDARAIGDIIGLLFGEADEVVFPSGFRKYVDLNQEFSRTSAIAKGRIAGGSRVGSVK